MFIVEWRKGLRGGKIGKERLDRRKLLGFFRLEIVALELGNSGREER